MHLAKASRKADGPGRAFLRADDGVMPILALLFFVMLMGVGGLAIDLGRLYGERGQMQAYVDAAALTAASQLDKQPDAITRAYRAARGDVSGGPLVTGTGTQNFATVSGLDIERITILDVLGPDPGPTAATPATGDDVLCTWESGTWSPADCNTDANINQSAQFVEVRSTSRTVAYFILPIVDVIGRLFGAAPMINQQQIALRATAGYKSQICDITPMMICNPFEPPSNSNPNLPFTPAVGTQVLMKAGGNGSPWAPGDFGLVSVPSDAGGASKCNGNGASAISCMLGLVDPLTQCIDNDTIDVQPGEATSVANGLNTRFDIYEGSMQQKRTSPDFAPSANVTKGVCKITGNGQCTYSSGNGAANCLNLVNNTNGNGQYSATSSLPSSPTDKRTMPLPRDSDISISNRIGNGNWDRAAYWARNHPGIAWPPAGLSSTSTRYDVYRYEIENNYTSGNASGSTLARIKAFAPYNSEDGRPVCSNQTPVNNPKKDRRTLTMAVVNCHANNVQGNAPGVRAVAFLKMFLTEPVGLSEDNSNPVPSASTNDYYGEIVSVVKPGDVSGVLHVMPILYR